LDSVVVNTLRAAYSEHSDEALVNANDVLADFFTDINRGRELLLATDSSSA